MTSTNDHPLAPDASYGAPDDVSRAALLEIAFDQSASAAGVLRAVRDAAGHLTTLTAELVNRQAEAVLGVGRSDLLNQPFSDLFAEGSRAALLGAAEQVLLTDQPGQLELTCESPPTGQPIELAISLQPVGDGQRIMIGLTDVTGRKPAGSVWLNESILFETLASKVPQMGVLVIDTSGIINLATGLMPGLLAERKSEGLVGQLLIEQILPDYRPDWERYLATALEGESHFFSDHWNAWRCECYVGPVPDPAGAVAGALIVFRNVTEEYRQQQALQTMNQALQQSNEQLEQFAYVASHDLREPLRKIQLFSSLVGERATDRLEPADQDLLGRMQSAAHRLDAMIDGLLEQAQLDGPAPARTLINLSDLLRTLITDLAVTVHERAAVVELVPPLPMVTGDELQLRRLFQNLLTNALKFVEPGVAPRISIQARLVDAKSLPNLFLRADSRYAEISVSDNGIGIAGQDIEGIFGLFNRLHGRHQYAGTGIGLATVKKIVDKHQGGISVQSQEGGGTVFLIYLPVAPAVDQPEQ